jgi:transposase
MLYIGMDLHRNSSTFCVKDEKGNVIDRARIFTRPSAIKGYLKRFKERDSLKLVLEPVSQWYFYADLISRLGVEVKLANPLKIKAIASAKIKTDTIDANTLCDLFRANLLPEAFFKS